MGLARVGGHQGAGFVTERWVGGENDSLQSSVATTIIEVDDGDGIGVLWKHSRGGQQLPNCSLLLDYWELQMRGQIIFRVISKSESQLATMVLSKAPQGVTIFRCHDHGGLGRKLDTKFGCQHESGQCKE